MGTLKTSKDHVLVAYGRKNSKSKGKKKMKKKNQNSKSKWKKKMKKNNPRWNDEDEGSNYIVEGSNSKMKSKKKGITECSYCNKYFHYEKYCFNKNIDIMAQFL